MEFKMISRKVAMLGILIIAFLGCKDDDEYFQEVLSFDGDVVITTQAELDLFTSSRYNVINGDLTLKDGVTSLSSLTDLNEVDGELTIIDTELTTLDGLNNLNRVGGPITITSTGQPLQAITDFCALQPLFSSGEFNTVDISNNEFNPTVQAIAQGNCTQ